MTKPTREHILRMQSNLRTGLDGLYVNEMLGLIAAYLAQEEDMEKISPYVVGLVMEIADLKAENQALKAALLRLEV